MSVRFAPIPQNGVLRRLLCARRFDLLCCLSRTIGSASAPTTSRTIRNRAFGTDFRVSTISSMEVSSRLIFAGFITSPYNPSAQDNELPQGMPASPLLLCIHYQNTTVHPFLHGAHAYNPEAPQAPHRDRSYSGT